MSAHVVKDFSCLAVGDKACFTKTVTESDITLFAGITGDFNPLHINDNYARTTRFKKRIAHGMLTMGLISTAVTMMCGVGVYVSQEIKFVAPVFIGDTISASVEIIEKIQEKNLLVLKTTASNQDAKVVVTGMARVIVLG